MAERIIVWTQTARNQRRNILRYWVNRNRSKSYSQKLIRQIAEKVSNISTNPTAYKRCDFPKTRVAAMGHFSIFYQYDDNRILITAFWDNRQDPLKLEKLLR